MNMKSEREVNFNSRKSATKTSVAELLDVRPKSKFVGIVIRDEWGDMQSTQSVSRTDSIQVAIRALCGLFAVQGMALVAVTLTLAFANSASASDINVEFSRIGDATHFEFEGAGADRYKLSRDSQSVILRLPSLSEVAARRLQSLQDPQVKLVGIERGAVDGGVEIRWAASPKVEFFEYVSDSPRRLIVDFFPIESAAKLASSPALGPAQPASVPSTDVKRTAPASLPEKKLDQPTQASANADEDEDEDSDREPASADFVIVTKSGQVETRQAVGKEALEEISLAEKLVSRSDFERGIFDGGDPEFKRFLVRPGEIKASAQDESRALIRIPFPMLELGFPKLQALLKRPPIYEIRPQPGAENAEARLLLTLFQKKRQALLLKTGQEFLKKYPRSEYDEMIRYLMADTHYDLWASERQSKSDNKISMKEGNRHDTDFESAMGLYGTLAEKYPKSPMTERTLLLMGYSYLERGDPVNALKTFQRFVRLRPESNQAGQVKLSIARAYLFLNRWDDALKELDDVEKNAKNPRDRAEAAFRRGDVLFRQAQLNKTPYTDSMTAYQRAIDSYPEATGRFPNAFYNLAEAQFRMDRHVEAIDSYRKFLQKFPQHKHGGFAMTRIGELIESLVGADDPRVTGAFFESYFRFRSTPGADIARVRVLTGRMPKMKDKELKDSIREIDEIVKRNDDLPLMPEFRTITAADALTHRGEFDLAVKNLDDFYRANSQSRKLDLIKSRIVHNIVEKIGRQVREGDFIQALRTYSANRDGWLKTTDRLDLPFYVASAYEKAGVFNEAQKHYAETLAALEKRGKAKPSDPFERTPSTDRLRLRLAATAAQDRDFMAAESHLKNLRAPASLPAPEQAERAELAAATAEARGQVDLARNYLSQMAMRLSREAKSPEQVAREMAQLHLRETELSMRAKDWKRAEESAARAWSVVKTSEDETMKAKALETQAEVLLRRGKRSEAIAAYKTLLELNVANADHSRGGYDSVRYRLGRIYFEAGNLKLAEETWTSLPKDSKNIWSQLASEQMTSARWREDYKKYIDRIPAAEGLR
jgi:tetratricopeptide (TPR) repeat protein